MRKHVCDQPCEGIIRALFGCALGECRMLHEFAFVRRSCNGNRSFRFGDWRFRPSILLNALSAAVIQHCDLCKPLDPPRDPAKTAFLVGMRVEHPRHLTWRSEEVLVNKRIV